MGLKENKNLSELSRLYEAYENSLIEWGKIDDIKKSIERSLSVQLRDCIDRLTSNENYAEYSTQVSQ
jgi:hypothetical protein